MSEKQHEIIRIPMIDTIFDELEDAFIGEKETAHDFIWGQIRTLCADAKMGKLNKACTYNILKDGVPVHDSIKLRGLELENVPSNPEWIPKKMEKDEAKYFEHKVTDKTFEYLKLFASFAVLRHDKFGESIQSENEKQLTKLSDDKVIAETIEKQAEAFAKFQESRPECIEESIFNAIYPVIYKHVAANVSTALDKENEEMYPKEEAAKTA